MEEKAKRMNAKATRIAKIPCLWGAALVLTILFGCVSAPPADVSTSAPAFTYPQTPEGKVLEEFITEFNKGDEALMLEFIKTHFSPALLAKRSAEQHTAMMVDMRLLIGTVSILSMTERPDGKTEALACNRSGTFWPNIILKLDAAPSTLIRNFGIGMSGVTPPESVVIDRMPDKALAAKLETLLADLVAHDEFSGTVLVARNGKPFFHKAYGYANLATKEKNAKDTKYNIASMGKMLSSVAIAQLVQVGKLSYDDKVGKLLPDYPNADVAAKVSVKQLLTHTSGLSDVFTDEYFEKKGDFRNTADWLGLFVNEPLLFEPGTDMAYSNAGFVVLGAILEKLSGMSYHDYIRTHIVSPSNMKNTGPFPKAEKAKGLAVGYTFGETREAGEVRTENWDCLPYSGFAAGGYSASAPDFLAFAEALRTNKLLDEKYTNLITSTKVEMGPDAGYGYGFDAYTIGSMRVVGHSGGIEGVSTMLQIYPDQGIVVVIFSNYDFPSAEMVAGFIQSRLSK